MARSFVFEAAGVPTGAARSGAFTWLAIGDQLVRYTTAAGVEQERLDVGGPVEGIGTAEGDLIVSVGGRTLQYRSGGMVPEQIEAGPYVTIVDGEVVSWLVGSKTAQRVRQHHLDPPIEVDARRATVVADELWWVTEAGLIVSSAHRRVATVGDGLPEVIVGCAGWLWMSHGSRLDRVSLTDGQWGEAIQSPIGSPGHMTCVGGRLAVAGPGGLFVFNPISQLPPAKIDLPVGGRITGLSPGPDLVWVLTDTPEVAVVRFD